MQGVASRANTARSALVRLRWVGVAIPLVALLVAETIRYLMPGEEQFLVHLLWGAAAGAGIVVFAMFMFWGIGRVEHELVRQNHELGAINALSRAVQDEESSRGAVEAALRSLVAATGALRAQVRIFGGDDDPRPRPIVHDPSGGAPDLLVQEPVEIPLTTGSAVVGMLQVWLPERGEALSPPALQNISHQLGCAIQMRQLLDDLQRRQQEADALYGIAVQISDQQPLADVLAGITRIVREQLAADQVAICLTPGASAVVSATSPADVDEEQLVRSFDGALCVTLEADRLRPAHGAEGVCALRSSAEYRQVHETPIRGGEGALGAIWAGRRTDRVWTASERALVSALADLASIAITSARLRERDRLNATVAERERIARELHDSLAQVLGVTHLRLRAIGTNRTVRDSPEVARELDDLADLAQDAYRDVREAILGLRSASSLERGFVPSLAAYVEKFSRQSGVLVSLDARMRRDPELAPESEIQVIRVIQEALANVRKHAGAASAVVRLSDDGDATTIEVEDDGRGFDVTTAVAAHDEGFGLQTMRERIDLVGGTLEVRSAPGTGTCVRVRIPRDRARIGREGGERADEAVAASPAGR